MQLASSFGRNATMLRSHIPLSNDQIHTVAPSIFAQHKHTSRSDRYTYIPTIEVLRGLRAEGFMPFMVCQTRSRDGSKQAHAKHMLRLRHASQIEYGEGQPAPVTEEQVLQARRYEDRLGDLWTTFSRVQENLVRGGLRGRAANGRPTTKREIKGIDANVKLNRALWVLAEEMCRLKA